MIKEDELKYLIGKKIMVRLGICYLVSYYKDESTGLYTLNVIDDYRDFDSIKTISRVCLSDIVKNPKARLTDKIIKYDDLKDIAYFQEPFFFIDLKSYSCGWTFVDKLNRSSDVSYDHKFNIIYQLKGIGNYIKQEYGKTWLAFTDDVDPELIRRKKSSVNYLKFI